MAVLSLHNTDSWKSRAKRAGRIFVLIAAPLCLIMGLSYIYFNDPNTQQDKFVPCLTYLLTGLYCPGCGNTRALHALVHLDFPAVLGNNLLFPFLFVILGWLLTGEYLNLLLGRRVLWLPKKVSPVLIVAACAAVIAFTILRNTDIYPFCLLAPGV